MPKLSLKASKSVGSKVVLVKVGMLLYAAYPQKTPPSKAVRQFDMAYLFGCLEKLWYAKYEE